MKYYDKTTLKKLTYEKETNFYRQMQLTVNGKLELAF